MMSAAAMTGFQKGLGRSAMSHPVGAVFNTHTARPTPCACQLCYLQCRQIRGRFDQAAAYLGSMAGSTASASLCSSSSSFAIPRTLTEMGVSADRLDDLVAMALEDVLRRQSGGVDSRRPARVVQAVSNRQLVLD